jgi:hypothetical protein
MKDAEKGFKEKIKKGKHENEEWTTKMLSISSTDVYISFVSVLRSQFITKQFHLYHKFLI